MSQLKFKVSMLLVFVAAFAWGYKKDDLQRLFEVAVESTAPTAETSASVAEPGIQSASPLPNAAPMPNISAPSRIQSTPPATTPSVTAPSGAPAPNIYTPPANPYANLNKQLNNTADADSFREAFGSVQRNSITQAELMKKNSYFRKLSEDLEKLQGEPEPVAGTAEGDPTNLDPSIPQPVAEGLPPEPNQLSQPGSLQQGTPQDDEFFDEAMANDATLRPLDEEAVLNELDSLIEEGLLDQ